MQTIDSGLEALFTLESSKTGIIEEPPFRILVLGDWSGDGLKSSISSRKPIQIDRDNFDEILSKLHVRSLLDLDGSELELEFNELDDFHPDQIFRRVPLFSELRDLRKRLTSEDTFYAAAREVREKFGIERETTEQVEQPSEERPQADDLLGAILEKPAGGATVPKPKASSELGSLIADLVRPHLVSVNDTERTKYVAAIDQATSGLMRSIIHNRTFQELEAAWRGLYFLVRRTETSADLKLYILDLSKEELADDLRSGDSLTNTVLYEHLVHEAAEAPGGEPWALTIGNYGFSADLDDIASLIRISKIAAAANAPFISHMRPDVLGIHSLDQNTDPSTWNVPEDSSAAKLWSAICNQSESVYLGMTIPRFLVRLPYGADTDPLETFMFEEFVDAPVHDQYVWSNAIFIAAQLLAASYSEGGWEMGRRLLQDLDGLPVHVYKEGTETVFKPCSEVLLSDKAVNALLKKGLMPLVSYKNTDKVKLAQFQSIAGTVLKGRWT